MAGSRTLKLSILADVDNLKKNLDTGSKEVEGFGDKLEKFGKVAAAAFAAAAAAAVAYAGKLAIEGVKAAIEDEAAQNRLAAALENVTGATDKQIAAVEEQIGKMSLAFGVADDQLRPAYQRLATATGSLTEAEEGLSLALDIAASKQISVEQAANILSKAYEGNFGAVSKLGVGMSAAELKAIGLEGTLKVLSDTFGGAATRQANTLEGQIARLKVGFDEAKEAIGTALLPIVEKLMNYFVNTLIPKFQEAKSKAIDPIIKAFKDNEEAMRDLWAFTKAYLIPLFETVFVNAIEGVGKVIGGIVDTIGKAVTLLKNLINTAIDGMNEAINLYNKLPFPDISPIRRIGTSTMGTTTPTTSGFGARPYGERNPADADSELANRVGPIEYSAWVRWHRTTNQPETNARTYAEQKANVDASYAKFLAEKNAKNIVPAPAVTATQATAVATAANTGTVLTNALNAGSFRMGEAATMQGVTINVNAPSMMDEEGFVRGLVEAMNQAQARTGSGGGKLTMAIQ